MAMDSPIKDFPHYLVRDDGSIFSLRLGRALKPGVDAKGYCRQPLRRADGKPVCHYVHRLVAQCFLPAQPPGHEIDHIDGNPSNNAASNLRWLTHRENIGAAMARRGNWLANAEKRVVPIVAVDAVTGVVTRFTSLVAACEAYGAACVANGGTAKTYAQLAGNICHARDRNKVAYGSRWCSPRKRLAIAVAIRSAG